MGKPQVIIAKITNIGCAGILQHSGTVHLAMAGPFRVGDKLYPRVICTQLRNQCGMFKRNSVADNHNSKILKSLAKNTFYSSQKRRPMIAGRNDHIDQRVRAHGHFSIGESPVYWNLANDPMTCSLGHSIRQKPVTY